MWCWVQRTGRRSLEHKSCRLQRGGEEGDQLQPPLQIRDDKSLKHNSTSLTLPASFLAHERKSFVKLWEQGCASA